MIEPIIKSILDNDLYKFTMQQAVLEIFPEISVSYRFHNRGKQKFTPQLLEELKTQIYYMSELSLTEEEFYFLKQKIPYLKPMYLQFLKNYRYNPKEVDAYLDEDNNLVITITGYWYSTILWEVPLLAIISELYYQIIDTHWIATFDDCSNQCNALNKIKRMHEAGCIFSEFGTRRRRSYKIQDQIVGVFSRFQSSIKTPCFLGTSNVYLAMKYDVKPMGTMAHEWAMGISALEGLRHANFYMLRNWERVYNADLGIALTDTFGTDSFFENFNKRMTKTFDGVRHDSGCPFIFADKAIAHYKKMGVNPLSKFIIFSDALTVDKAIEIKKYCEGKINCSFGIGTHFTNDFVDSPALNIVIKLWSCDGTPVVKLSDAYGKVMGDRDAVRVAKWTFFRTPLDE